MKIYGKNAIKETLKANVKFEKILIQQNLDKTIMNEISQICKEKNIKIIFSTKEELNKISANAKHQGLIGYCQDFVYSSLESIIFDINQIKENLFVVILNEIEDPHNLGSIVRTCECAGVDGVIIQKNRSCPVNETVLKTSAGAINHIKIHQATNINETIKYLKNQNVFVYGLEANGTPIKQSNLTGKVALIVGSEGFGINSLTKKLCDEIVSLPLKGKINSLNASVACGIAIYEVLNQRN